MDKPLTLDVLIRRMEELRDEVEAGELARKTLNTLREVAAEAMDPSVAYRTDFGTLEELPRLHRITRDAELTWRCEGRPVVESSTVEVDPDLVAGLETIIASRSEEQRGQILASRKASSLAGVAD